MGAVGALQDLRPLVPTAIHGDFRLDNMLFDGSGSARPVTVVDWQTVHVGSGPQDVAYFIGNAFADVDERREHEERLVRDVSRAAGRARREGLHVRRSAGSSTDVTAHASLIMAIAASMLVGPHRARRSDVHGDG